MGISASGIVAVDDVFLQNTTTDSFVLSMTQCIVEGPIPFGENIINKRKNTQNFVVFTKGEPRPIKVWHSKSILVCALTVSEPPLEEFLCSFYQFHNQPFLAIHVDPCTYYHICFFMNKSRFFAKREEFLQRILGCMNEKDGILQKFIRPPTKKPEIRFPKFSIALPVISEVDDNSSQVSNEISLESNSERVVMSRNIPIISDNALSLSRRGSEDSFFGPISEPDSLNDSLPGTTVTANSSIFPPISEPNTRTLQAMDQFVSSGFLPPIPEPHNTTSAVGSQSEMSSARGDSSSVKRKRVHTRRNELQTQEFDDQGGKMTKRTLLANEPRIQQKRVPFRQKQLESNSDDLIDEEAVRPRRNISNIEDSSSTFIDDDEPLPPKKNAPTKKRDDDVASLHSLSKDRKRLKSK